MQDVDPNLLAAITADEESEKPRKRGETKHFISVDELPFLKEPMEINANVVVSLEDLEGKHDLMDKLARVTGKVELSEVLNEIAVSQGQRATFTPAMLSAVASARIRRDQKQKRKNRR